MPHPPLTWADVVPAVAAALEDARVKYAADGLPGLSHLADVAGWRAGELNSHWGGPRPLTTTLIGSGLGALLGYGGGRLAENIFPEGTFEPGEPRRRFAVMGAALGTAPGIYQGLDNLGQGKGVLDSWPPPANPAIPAAGVIGGASLGVPKIATDVNFFIPLIDRERFQQVVFSDPRTPPNVQAATAGIVEAASRVTGNPVVTPWDVTRIALGAGTGLASGYVVGKTLGLLAGLSPEKQQQLQTAGAWSGVLRAIVPRALGFR